jgi:hypothetical protein
MRSTRSNLIKILSVIAVAAAVVAAAGLGVFQTITLPDFTGSRVTVIGSLQPANKVDVSPTRVEFINTSTEDKFSAPVENGHYSIDLPNHVFYRIQVTWTLVPGSRTGTSDSGTLNLNADSSNYTYDIPW